MSTKKAKAHRKTIYLTTPLQRALDGHENSSSRLADICARYQEICKRMLPEFTDNEWMLIRDCLNGSVFPSAQYIAAMVFSVEDAIQHDGLDEKWNVDGDALMIKMRSLTFTQCVAVVEAAAKWIIDNESTVYDADK